MASLTTLNTIFHIKTAGMCIFLPHSCVVYFLATHLARLLVCDHYAKNDMKAFVESSENVLLNHFCQNERFLTLEEPWKFVFIKNNSIHIK